MKYNYPEFMKKFFPNDKPNKQRCNCSDCKGDCKPKPDYPVCPKCGNEIRTSASVCFWCDKSDSGAPVNVGRYAEGETDNNE